MNCKYCNCELRIKKKHIDGKPHRIAYCDKCHKKWDLDKNQQSILPVIMIFLVLFILIAIAAIIISKTFSNNKNDSNATTHLNISEETTPVSSSSTQSEKTFSGLQAYLSEEGIISGEASETMYEYIGAINGVKYLNSNIELYEYDTSSDTYQTIVNTMEISGITVAAVNGPYILILSNNENNDNAVAIFKSY